MKKLLVVLALFIGLTVTAVHADCIWQNGRQYCSNDAQVQAVPQYVPVPTSAYYPPPVYYPPAYYGYVYYPPVVGFGIRVGGGRRWR